MTRRGISQGATVAVEDHVTAREHRPARREVVQVLVHAGEDRPGRRALHRERGSDVTRLAHQRRGLDAATGGVTDEQTHPAVGEAQHVVPVAADRHACSAGQIARFGADVVELRQRGGKERELQRVSDVALLAARVQALPSARRLDIDLPADSRRLHELRTRVARWLEDAGVATDVVSDVVIALNEAASNSMLHAYSGVPGRGHVRVSLTIDERRIIAAVLDDGHWLDRRDEHDGRGLDLMSALMTEVRLDHTPAGTRVHLTRQLHA